MASGTVAAFLKSALTLADASSHKVRAQPKHILAEFGVHIQQKRIGSLAKIARSISNR